MILLLQYTLIFASVLILVALGGCFAEHSGVINLGLEGIMIMGALGGALTMRYVPNTVPAIVMILAVILVSALVGMVYSCLLAVASINFKADQTLVGTALNLLGTAGATVIVKAINTAANPDDVSSIVQYGSAKNALLALAGDVGCSGGPTLVGFVSGILSDNLKKGILAGVIFPVFLLVGILLLGKSRSAE